MSDKSNSLNAVSLTEQKLQLALKSD